MTEHTNGAHADSDNTDSEHIVLHFDQPLLLSAQSVFRLAVVGDDLQELLESDTVTYAWQQARNSIARRGLQPVGKWFMGVSPLDDPDWRAFLDEEVAVQVAAQMESMEGECHWLVFTLLDTDELD